MAWALPAADAPGVYRVTRGGEVVFAAAAAVPAEESDLRPLGPAVLPERLGGGRAVAFHAAAGDDERDALWATLDVGCVVCPLGELIALKAFRA